LYRHKLRTIVVLHVGGSVADSVKLEYSRKPAPKVRPDRLRSAQ
jgi:hypothetical protein